MKDHGLLEMMVGSRFVLYYVGLIFQVKEFKILCIGKGVIAKIFQKTNI